MGIEVKDPLTGEVITFGTLDCWGYDEKGGVVVIDWKTGMPDDYDAQIIIYSLGLMDRLGVDKVSCFFVYGDKQKIARLEVTKDEAEFLLADTLRRREDPDEPYQKSKWCNRCAVRPECPLWNDAAQEALSVVGMDLEFSDGLEVIVKSPDKLGRFIKGWKAIAKLVEDYDVTGRAISFIEHGTPVGNYEVRERKGRRTYAKDSVATLLQLIKEGDLDLDRAASMFNLDPNEVDKFFKDTSKPCPINTIVKGTFKILVERNGK